MKVLVGTFNQEKALIGAFSVIVKKLSDGSFEALMTGLLLLLPSCCGLTCAGTASLVSGLARLRQPWVQLVSSAVLTVACTASW